MRVDLSGYKSIIVLDSEFNFIARDGGRPDIGGRPVPLCLCALELRSGTRWTIWREELLILRSPPFPIDNNTLFVAFVASAEMGVFRVLGWPIPEHILDLSPEFRTLVSGRYAPAGRGLIGALAHFGLAGSTSVVEKDTWRDRILEGGPFSAEERARIEAYCMSDVEATSMLLTAMWSKIEDKFQFALIRGTYTGEAQSFVEYVGVPIDFDTFTLISENWDHIDAQLIARYDRDFGIFDEVGSFSEERFAACLNRLGLPWPRLPGGRLELKDRTFESMVKIHPILRPIRELRHVQSALRLHTMAVGLDGRNRTPLWAFGSKTSRNQPSNASFIFGASVALRGLIQARPGWGVAYVDWSQQEVGIAAALSEDEELMRDYFSGDVYLNFGKRAALIPGHATKATHEAQRESLKVCVLGMGYGLGAHQLAFRIGRPLIYAKQMLKAHRMLYPVHARWSDHNVEEAVLGHLIGRPLETCFRWPVHLGAKGFRRYGTDDDDDDPGYRPNSSRNFKMQANAEMMRLACILTVRRGVELCAPIHDALLIHAPLDRLEHDIAVTQAAMAEASRIVLDGFELRTDVKVFCYPQRYMDKRGKGVWDEIMGLLPRVKKERA